MCVCVPTSAETDERMKPNIQYATPSGYRPLQWFRMKLPVLEGRTGTAVESGAGEAGGTEDAFGGAASSTLVEATELPLPYALGSTQ